MSIELALLILSLLFFMSILSGKAGSKFGVPSLLLFLGVGMVFGGDGLGVKFEDYSLAQTVGTVALCIILFSGGMDTKVKELRPVVSEGILLSTLGVLLTALITGIAIFLIFKWINPDSNIGLLGALLLASTMSSTDSASVFAILRSRGVNLKHNLRPLLELESGSNDPMAYMMVITLMEMISAGSEANYYMALASVTTQLIMGGASGLILGYIAVKTINRIRIDNDSLYPILVLTFGLFTFSVTYFLQGNGYLAVYVAGLFIGNKKFANKRITLNFFDGIAWLLQLVMFLMLGLLVSPKELLDVIVPALIVSFVMIFLSRPFSVFACMLPFKRPLKDKLYVSWVGLRGAVPIIFAIMPLAADIPGAKLMFNVVFFCTLVSLLVQGTSLTGMARWMRLAEKSDEPTKLKDFDIDMSSDIDAVISEVTLNEESLLSGNRLMDIKLPKNSLVTMVKRDDKYFVPTGGTELMENDILLVMADSKESMQQIYEKLKV